MTISFNWLKEYITFDQNYEEITDILTSIGLEVESVEVVEEIPGGLSGVVVGHVVECVQHPDADRLRLTKVDVGEKDLLQIVCGAPNVATGQKVLVATVGSKLTTTGGEEIKIKRSKIRGVESEGMICAEDELGLGESHEGIMVLDSSSAIGMSAKEYLKLESDVVFEIGLTPNRVDAASHIGVARDLYAWMQSNGVEAELHLPQTDGFKEGIGRSVPLQVLSSEGAPRYMGITLENIKVGPSPKWLQKRLMAIGSRPINNIVDITNYILHEIGQPLHAFDADKIKGGRVVVRMASEGEKFITLDGVERTLNASDLMICNEEGPMCIAGVFGGLNSGVTESTTTVFLESAYFNPVYIRRTSKRLGLKTDASFRYERGTDPQIVPYAAKRAVLMMQELAGAKVAGDVKEFYPEYIEKKRVTVDIDKVERLLGKKIGRDIILKILTSLNYEVISDNSGVLEVLVPSYMVDVYREADVAEEILRIYGYNNIELPEHIKASVNIHKKPDPELFKKTLCDFLSSNGFNETMNNSLTKSDYYKDLKTFPEDNLVMILNPLSTDLNAMRQTLILNGLEVMGYNMNRQINDLRIYELGNVYFRPDGDATHAEEKRLSILMSSQGKNYWRNGIPKGDFFLLKGYLELLMKRLGINIYNLETGSAPEDLFSEGVTYLTNGGRQLAVIGTISKKILKQFGVKQPVFAVEISYDQLFKLYRKQRVQAKDLPKFPEVKRDLALLSDENISYADIRKTILSSDKRLVKDVILFDVYRGDKIPAGKKQYAVSITLQDTEKTLTDQFVDILISKILSGLEKNYGVLLRG